MKLYRIPIRLASPLASELKGDTIWMHVVWGIANHEGDDAARRFLEESKGAEPELVVSSAFPAGFVCKDLPVPEKREESLSLEERAKIKKKKKKRHEKALKWLDAAPPPAGGGKKGADEGPPGFEGRGALRNTINRLAGTVVENGGLYSARELWPKNPRFDVYAPSTLEIERPRKLFERAFENGFGADASPLLARGDLSLTGRLQRRAQRKAESAIWHLAPLC